MTPVCYKKYTAGKGPRCTDTGSGVKVLLQNFGLEGGGLFAGWAYLRGLTVQTCESLSIKCSV